MEVLAAAAVSEKEHLERQGSPEGSDGSSEQQAASPAPRDLAPTTAKTKAAVAAEVAEEHQERISTQSEASLARWTEEVHGRIPEADAAFLAARDAHMHADAARAAAREAFRSDQKSEAKSTEWHAKVSEAQKAHEAVREAREELYRLQALADMLSRELQRRRAGTSGGTQATSRRSSEPPAAGAGAAAAAGAAEPALQETATDERLLVPPAAQGTKRRRGAPPEECPFCNHSYTVRDGLSSRLDASGARLHLRRCQCRKKTPPCRNCPECKQRPDVMRLGNADAAFDLCQRLYACGICACKCPAVGKWIESDGESRRAFQERTQKRQDELAELGWQETGTAQQPTSTAGGTASAATTTAAPSASAGAEVVHQRPRRHTQRAQQQQQQQQQPAVSSLSTRRLPADIRQQLEQMQAQRQQVGAGQALAGQAGGCDGDNTAQAQHAQQVLGAGQGPRPGQSLDSGWQPPRPRIRSAAAQQPGAGSSGGRHGSPPPKRHQHQHPHHHHHHHSPRSHGRPDHHHTCNHPHEDCTSDCCSAPTVAPAVAGNAAAAMAAAGLLPGSAGAAGGPAELLLLQSPAAGITTSGSLGQLWETLAAAGWPTTAMAAALQRPAALPLPQPALAQPQAPAPPELPAEVLALVDEVFAAAAGQQMATAVADFLQRQRLMSLSDLEFLELAWLERELTPLGLPTLLLNKFLVLGRRRAAAPGMAASAAAPAGLASGTGGGGGTGHAPPPVAAAAVREAGAAAEGGLRQEVGANL